MFKRIWCVGSAVAMLLAGCQTAKPTATTTPAAAMAATAVPAGPAIETLGTVAVPASEFAYVYRKNNSTAPDYGTRKSVADYLDLYTNFRLKVLAAEKKGLDTTQAFQRELDGYRQQLAQPYLTEKSVTDQLVREAYDRMGQEVNASHILIRVAPDATPKDTLAAYQKAVKIRQDLVGGADFGALASETSEDPSAKQNAGKLGYFTAMQMVYPFESAAYKTPVGQISQPVRTRFGYHIIKVNEKRPAQGEIKVAHLMVRATPGAAKADSLTAVKKINELYARLKKGEDWNKLVAQFSEDAGSAANGGELPPFGTGRMIPSFEEVAFKMQKPGDISAPVQTPYGWHIIKLIEKQPLAPFAEMEPALKGKVAKDSRSELNRAAFLKRIRQEDQFVEIPAAKAYVLAKADTALVAGRYKYVAPVTGAKTSKATKGLTDNATLFTIKGKAYPVKDFLAFAQQNQHARPGAEPQFAMQQLYDQYVDQSLTDYERNTLDTKYVDYRMLVKEYRDGILLFQLMDEKVWSKAIEDTLGLKKYFADNHSKYQWDQRVQATVVSAATPALLARAQQEMKVGRYPVTRGLITNIASRANLPTVGKRGTLALDGISKYLTEEDTLATITLVGRLAKGEKPALALARAEDAVKYLNVNKHVPLRRLKAVAKTSPAVAFPSSDAEIRTSKLEALQDELNEKNPLAVQITEKVFQKGDSKAVDDVLTRQPGTYLVQKDGRYFAITIAKNLPAGPKTLAEARGQATSDYQGYLEKEWIADLRQQYPVKVNEGEVNKLVNR